MIDCCRVTVARWLILGKSSTPHPFIGSKSVGRTKSARYSVPSLRSPSLPSRLSASHDNEYLLFRQVFSAIIPGIGTKVFWDRASVFRNGNASRVGRRPIVLRIATAAIPRALQWYCRIIYRAGELCFAMRSYASRDTGTKNPVPIRIRG